MSKPIKRRSAALYKDTKKAIRKGTAQAPAPKIIKHKREKGAAVTQVRPSAQQTSRHQSKQARVIAILRAPNGVTIEALMRETGWQPHSVRGFLARVVRKKLGLNLVSTAANNGRLYRIEDYTAARIEPASVMR
jgi:hypothetical protein